MCSVTCCREDWNITVTITLTVTVYKLSCMVCTGLMCVDELTVDSEVKVCVEVFFSLWWSVTAGFWQGWSMISAKCANKWSVVRRVVHKGMYGLGMGVCCDTCGLGMCLVDVYSLGMWAVDVHGPEKGVCFHVCGLWMWLIAAVLCCWRAVAVFGLVMGMFLQVVDQCVLLEWGICSVDDTTDVVSCSAVLCALAFDNATIWLRCWWYDCDKYICIRLVGEDKKMSCPRWSSWSSTALCFFL